MVEPAWNLMFHARVTHVYIRCKKLVDFREGKEETVSSRKEIFLKNAVLFAHESIDFLSITLLS
jgi:hypothetical protein